jgi:tRNA A-37 threonylcarbamoyl transferase component Bud32
MLRCFGFVMSSEPDLQPAPLRVDRYRLFDEIGAGGMARVHLGKLVGAQGFARVVAIKRLHPHLVADAAARAMLVDEARLSSRVVDPHVVRVLDVIDHEGDVALVMEYVLGEALSRALAERRELVPLPVAVAIVTDVLAGLHAAHEARGADGRPLGIVHRDVSPQNVLVGIDGRARVIDFGIAKAANRIARTQSGVTKGKHAYMAPEQLLGQPVSREADVYAAGVVLWEVLTGKPLFDGGDGEGIALRVAQSVTTGASDERPEVPRALDAILLRALSLRPADRPPTAAAFAEGLARAVKPASRVEVARWLESVCGVALEIAQERLARVERAPDEVAVAVAPPASVPRAVAPKRSSRWAVVAALAAVGALGGGALALRPREAPAPSPPPAVAPVASNEAAPEPEVIAAPAPSPPETSAPRAPTKRPTAKGKPSRANCTPPYTFDEAGHKIFKPQCF